MRCPDSRTKSDFRKFPRPWNQLHWNNGWQMRWQGQLSEGRSTLTVYVYVLCKYMWSFSTCLLFTLRDPDSTANCTESTNASVGWKTDIPSCDKQRMLQTILLYIVTGVLVTMSFRAFTFGCIHFSNIKTWCVFVSPKKYFSSNGYCILYIYFYY